MHLGLSMSPKLVDLLQLLKNNFIYRVVRCTVCTSEFDTKANVEAHIMAEHSTELLDDQGN